MRKKVAIAAMSAGLVGGAVAGTVFTPMISGAQTTPSTQAPSTQAPSGQTPANGQASPGQPPADRQQKTKDALAELVAQGVINQAQADAVLNKLQTIGPPDGGHGGGHRGPKLDVAAQAIGITTDQLQQELQAGKSLADVAKAHNVDPQKVIDAMVAEEEKHLAQEVTDGKLTQAEADQRKSDLQARITERVNSTKPQGGRGPGGPGRDSGAANGSGTPGTQAPPTTATPATPGN